MKPRVLTYFSGGGVFEATAEDLIEPVGAVEYEQKIADVYVKNFGNHMVVGDVRSVDPSRWLGAVDHFHASPVCKNFSLAKAGAIETQQDIETAQAVIRAIETLKPLVVSVENVWKYRKSWSFQTIYNGLNRLGYHVRFWKLNSADFGIPQTRERLILIARLDRVPQCPEATHTRNPQESMFGEPLKKWIGWYEAIEDLIPTLPDSQLSDWQLAFLEGEYGDSFLINGLANSYQTSVTMREPYEPSMVVGADYHKHPMKAVLIESRQGSRCPTVRQTVAPSPTIHTQAYRYQVLDSGVKVLTPRAIARFQGLTDSYWLPDHNETAGTVIGIGAPYGKCVIQSQWGDL